MPIPASAVREIPSAANTLIISADFSIFTPEALFDHWTTPDLLCQWWPPHAELDPRPGGACCLAWPRMNWYLRGHYTAFERGKTLAFTWKWDHEPAAPVREVAIAFALLESGGTQIRLTHGPYDGSREDAGVRAGHLEGWTHFLGKLGEVQQRGGMSATALAQRQQR